VGTLISRDMELPELLYFLTKGHQVRYKQTVLGGFGDHSACFHHDCFYAFLRQLAKMPRKASLIHFCLRGLLPWTYFANAVSASGNSLVEAPTDHEGLFSTHHDTRFSSSGCLLDFAVPCCSAVLMVTTNFSRRAILVFRVWYPDFPMRSQYGLWLSALNVQFRDIRYVIPLLFRFGFSFHLSSTR